MIYCKIVLLTMIFTFASLSVVTAQDNLTLKTSNQKIIGNDFFFDIILEAPDNDIFLGNSVLLLNFNKSVFINPQISKVPLGSTGFCTFIPIVDNATNIELTREHYFNGTMTSIIDNEIEIVVSVDQPQNTSNFESTIADIDNSEYWLGTFKISGLAVSLGIVDLKWKTSCISCGQYSEVKTISSSDFSESPVVITTVDQPFDQIDPAVSLNLKVNLEGAYEGTNMLNELVDVIPCIQPYSTSPWAYGGTEEVDRDFISNNDIVDWVLVELRSGSFPEEATTTIGMRAGLVTRTGVVLDIDGQDHITFVGVQNGNYFIVVHHRNHISIMSSTDVTW